MVSKARLAANNLDIRLPNSGRRFVWHTFFVTIAVRQLPKKSRNPLRGVSQATAEPVQNSALHTPENFSFNSHLVDSLA